MDRMVTLELAARGFRDPALVEIKQRDLRKAFAAELRECTSLPMDGHTMECIHHVASTDQMLEECFAD